MSIENVAGTLGRIRAYKEARKHVVREIILGEEDKKSDLKILAINCKTSQKINDENFPKPGKFSRKLLVFDFGDETDEESGIKQMENAESDPANLYEALAGMLKDGFKDLHGMFLILGSKFDPFGGYPMYPVIRSNGEKNLGLVLDIKTEKGVKKYFLGVEKTNGADV
jgi:hypothetical protein